METVLAKKLSGALVGHAPIPEIEQLATVMGRAFDVSLMGILQTQVSTMVLDCEVVKMMEVSAEIPAPAMLGVFSFAGSENKALVNMTSDLVYHIVDLRMGGDPGACPATMTRSFTSIDEALCEHVLREVALGFERATEQILKGPLATGFEMVGIHQDITEMFVAPETSDVLKITLALDIGSAARGGDVEFIVPLSVLDFVRSAIDEKPKSDEDEVTDIWHECMKAAVGQSELPLSAVLARMKLKSDVLRALEVGMVLPISNQAPQNVGLEIVINRKNRYEVVQARLGVFEGTKVLKLNAGPSTAMIRNIRNALEI